MAIDPNTKEHAYLLTTFAQTIRKLNKNGLTDLDTAAETIFCVLLNRIRGWNLKNMNIEQPNFPGVDLTDYDARIAVQVTAERTPRKVRDTLNSFAELGYEKDFDHLILLLVNQEPTDTMKELMQGTWSVNGRTVKREIWDISRIIREIDAMGDVNRLAEIITYLQDQIWRYPMLQVQLPSVPPVLLGIEDESFTEALEELRKALEYGKPIFIHGVEGIGKTQLAFHFAWKCAPRDCMFLFNYTPPEDETQEAMRETVLRAEYRNYTFSGDDPDAEFEDKLEVLSQEKFRGSMLIIDNFYRAHKTLSNLIAEPSFEKLRKKCHNNQIQLVFTTPYPVEGWGYQYEGIGEYHIKSMMRKSVGQEDVSETELEELILASDGHTMLTKLIAKTIDDGWGEVETDHILHALKYGPLNHPDFSSVELSRYPKHDEATMYQHVEKLYDFAEINANEQNILCYASLFPESGMDIGIIKNVLDSGQFDLLKRLHKRGWVIRDRRKKRLKLHPVIRSICRERVKPTDAMCRPFLERLWQFYQAGGCTEESEIMQLAECFDVASQSLEDMNDEWRRCKDQVYQKCPVA